MADFLVFRPEPKCSKSVERLTAAGLNVIGQPLQEIQPDTEEIQAFNQYIHQLPAKAYVVFTSTFAVEYGLASFKSIPWPEDLTCFAVGKSTADMLQQAGLKVRLPKRFDSEGLLEMAELIDVKDKHVVIAKGHNGRQTLVQELTEREAEVKAFNLYHRHTVQLDDQPSTWQQSSIQYIIVTSGEQIDIAFAQCDQDWLLSRRWITVSQRLVERLKEKGIKHIHLSEGANDEALIASAKHCLNDALEQEGMAQENTSEQQQKLQELAKEVQSSKASTSSSTAASTPPKQTPGSASKGSNSQGNNRAATSKESRIGVSLFTGINFLLLLAVIGAGYWAWLQWQDYQHLAQQRIVEQQQTQQQQLDENKDYIRRYLTNLKEEQSQNIAAFADQISALEQQLQASRVQMQEMSGRRPSDWVLAEADYLVRMAGRKLWLEHDTETAVLMLQNADQRLADLNDPSLLPIRSLLADDIQTIQLINNVSVSDIALQLAALVKQVNNLPLAMVKLPEPDVEEPDNKLTESVSDWR